MKQDDASIKTLLIALGIWCLLTAAYILVVGLVNGLLKPGQFYVWELMLRTEGIRTLEIGVLTITFLWMFCRKLPRKWRVICAAIAGLIFAPLIGLGTGLMHERLGNSVMFSWNALEGWISGLMLAVPNAVVVSLMSIRMLGAQLPHSSQKKA